MSVNPNPIFDFAPSLLPKPSHSAHRRTLSSVSVGASRNSSLQKVWAEDYFDSEDDYVVDDSNCWEASCDKIPRHPPPATLTTRPFPRSIPLSADEESFPARQPRTHQRSLTALLPFRSRTNSTSPQRSPVKEKDKGEFDFGFMPTLTGDRNGTIRVEDRSKGGLSSWFNGSSAPVPVGIPVVEQESPLTIMSSRDASPERREAAKLKKRPTLSTLDSNPPNITANKTPPTGGSSSTSRFGNFFSSPKTPHQTTIQLPQTTLENDELLTLDINTALFPSGQIDPFSPAAFKNLLINAEGLLLKLQTAYKLRTLSLHELSAEKEAMSDELEEAETRAKCLRSQLEDMAQRVSDQDQAMEDLVRQLAVEKQARAEEKEAREKSIALIKTNRENRASCCSSPEDLGISQAKVRGKWRNSAGSTDLSTTEGDSDTESVFSRSRSPTLITSSAASTLTTESTPELLQASFARVVSTPQQNQYQPRPRIVERPSTFQKILKGMSPTAPEPDALGGLGMGEEGCENCRGKDASVAWDAVGLLRAENKGLKERVGSLEHAVEGALDLCAGLRL